VKLIKIGLIEIEYMPFFVWYVKSGCNLNGEDIFDACQIGRLEIRRFLSKECREKWST